jgi:predicted metal-dependent hydrolase
MFTLRHTRAPKPNVVLELVVAEHPIKVTFRRMKSIRIMVNPPDGPTQKVIKAFVLERLAWLDASKAEVIRRTAAAPQIPVIPVTDGSIHMILGSEIRVGIARGFLRRGVQQSGSALLLKVRDTDGQAELNALFDSWKRDILKEAVGALIARYEPIMGVHVNEIGIKKMSTRWGTCAIKAKRVWINLALALFPAECLEMVVVHELTHLLERNHTKRFYALMTQYMPDWQAADKLLVGGIPTVD